MLAKIYSIERFCNTKVPEGHKRCASATKFRRLMIGQNCSAVCTNKDGHRDTFSEQAPHVSRGLLFVMSVNSLVVDSILGNIATVCFSVVGSSSCLHRGVWSIQHVQSLCSFRECMCTVLGIDMQHHTVSIFSEHVSLLLIAYAYCTSSNYSAPFIE